MTPPELGRAQDTAHAAHKMDLMKLIKDCFVAQHKRAILLTDNQQMILVAGLIAYHFGRP